MTLARPFIKWVGGKSQLLNEISNRYPRNFTKYCEPFVGGGAVLFDVLQRSQQLGIKLEAVRINDINKELINTYIQVQQNCSELILKLKELQDIYRSHTLEDNKEFFYQERERFNELKIQNSDDNNLEKAALFIFLNKTCFNGLYRVNSKGLFNVPFNNAKNPTLCDEENLRACSGLLKNVEMTVGDYTQCNSFIDSNTFVYMDPPYLPISQTSSFTSYTENGFTKEDQENLGMFIKELIKEKHANVLLSNSDPKNSDATNKFFETIYTEDKFKIGKVSAARMINSNAKKRGAINELLISNIASVF